MLFRLIRGERVVTPGFGNAVSFARLRTLPFFVLRFYFLTAVKQALYCAGRRLFVIAVKDVFDRPQCYVQRNASLLP